MRGHIRTRAIGAVSALTLAAGACIAAAPAASAAEPAIVSVGDVTITEGHSGNRTARMVIALDAPAPANVTVNWSATAGTATAGLPTQAATSADFKTASGVATLKAGTVSKPVTVQIYGDERAEGDETIAFTLSAPGTGLALGDASGTITILDDEATPGTVVSASDAAMLEGTEKTRGAEFSITLSRPSPGATVTYRVVPGTATGGWKGSGPIPTTADFGDFLGAPRTVSFANKAVQKNVKVMLVPDLFDEPDETFTIVIDSVTGATAGRNGTGTIRDDDATAPDDFGASSTLVGAIDPGSTLVGCEDANTRIIATASIHLDPSCTYTRGVSIRASDVTLDCRGAHIERAPAGTDNHGIQITTPTDVALHDITVRNCDVSKFSNNLRITRAGFKDLPFGGEYDAVYADVRIENNTFHHADGSGVFVDAFVTDVEFVDNTSLSNDGVGLYLEAGSKDNLVAGNRIEDNGYGDVIPGPAYINLGGTDIPYITTGREGIAVDGSRNNVIENNFVAGNSYGGIYLYKNCGEDSSKNGHWVRNYGATGNLIRNNVITDGPNGVWVGSRASENQYFMDCSDTPLISNPGVLYEAFLDYATDNTIEHNRIEDMTNAIRVEADRTIVRGNSISGGERGVLLGTKLRTQTLSQPVANTTISANTTVGVATPYSWVWGKGTTKFAGNLGNGGAGRLVAGTQPTINQWLFFVEFV